VPAPMPTPAPDALARARFARPGGTVAAPASKGGQYRKWGLAHQQIVGAAARCRSAGLILCWDRLVSKTCVPRASGRVEVYTGSGLRWLWKPPIIIKHGDSLLSSYAHNR